MMNSVTEGPAWSGKTGLGRPSTATFVNKLGLKGGMKLLLLQVPEAFGATPVNYRQE
jgi:hypothetical protein